jgi:5-methylcytosine-specific restriction endonuclease McrA
MHALFTGFTGEPFGPRRWTQRRARGESAFRSVLRADPCAYCGRAGGTVDHITPQSRGGTWRPHDLTGACAACNAAKDSVDLLPFLLARAA